MKFTDRLNAIEDAVLAFLRSRAIVRLFACAILLAEVARKLYPGITWVGNATEALVYFGAALGVVSPGLRKANGT